MAKNQIKRENEESQQYELKTNPKNILVEITLDNVARIEAIIRNDSSYAKSSDKNAGPQKSYSGSTAYWMTELKKYYDNQQKQYEIEKIIKEAVCAVDRENSTHLNADKKGREEMTGRIMDMVRDNTLYNFLKNRNIEIINILSEKTTGNKGRKNYSFATKFCHYACFYLFEEMAEQDNFSIYDNVLCNALPAYAKHFKVTKENGKEYTKVDFQNYETYAMVIDKIREIAGNKSGYTVSRNGFDHLLWYFHKARQ